MTTKCVTAERVTIACVTRPARLPTRPRRSRPHAVRPPPDPAHQCADRRSLRDLDIDGDLLIADGRPQRQARHRRRRRARGHRDHRLPRPGAGLVSMRASSANPAPNTARPSLRRASRAPPAASPPSCRQPAIDEPAMVDLVLRRARDTAIVHVHPMAALTKGIKGLEMTEIGLLKAASGNASPRIEEAAERPGNAPRPHLCPRFRCPHRRPHRGSRPGRRRRHEQERQVAARLGLIGVPNTAETVILERDIRLVALAQSRYHAASVTCGFARGAAPRQGCRPSRHPPRRPRSTISP